MSTVGKLSPTEEEEYCLRDYQRGTLVGSGNYGRTATCRACKAYMHKQRKAGTPVSIRAIRLSLAGTTKDCKSCGKNLPLDYYELSAQGKPRPPQGL